MDTIDIDSEIERIKKTAQSQGELNLMAAGLLAKAIAAQAGVQDLYVQNIEEFHKKFGLPYAGDPRPLPIAMSDFRVKFLEEELEEYRDAIRMNNLEKQFDALIDLVYIALGTAYLHGFPFRKGWQRVHTANMLKERHSKQNPSKRGSTFDIVKPDGWKAPTLLDLVTPPIS